MPQRYTEVEDDCDDFCFGGQIIACDIRRALVLFDYTGERESWPLPLVRRWLEQDTDPLCAALSSSNFGLQAT